MSNKALIVVVLVALSLGGLILFMNWRGSPTPAGAAPTPVSADNAAVRINASDVVGVKVKPGASAAESEVHKDNSGAASGWSFIARSPAGEESAWPIDPTNVQSLIRAISDMHPLANADRNAVPGSDAVVVTLMLKDGQSRALRMAPTPVGGRVLAAMDTAPAVMLDTSLLDLATKPGPSGWRIMRALGGASGPDLSRISLTSKDDTLAFSKLDGRWWLSRPVNAHANQQATGALLDALSKLPVERFIEDTHPDATVTGLNSPRLIIATERDMRTVGDGGEVSGETRKRDIFIGGPIDLAGTSLYASSDASGNTLFAVNAQAVAAISTAAKNYLDLTATGVSPGDIGIITLKSGKMEVGYRRQNGKWVKMLAGGKTDKAEVNQKDVQDAIEFFASRPGQPEAYVQPSAESAVAQPVPAKPTTTTTAAKGSKKGAPAAATAPARKPDEPIRTLAKVQLLTDDGAAIDTLTMGYTSDGTLAARNQNVIITYPGATAPKLLGMPEYKTLPASAGGPKRKATPPVGTSSK